jgi:hypothetical protein
VGFFIFLGAVSRYPFQSFTPLRCIKGFPLLSGLFFFCLATKEAKMPERPFYLLDFLSLAAVTPAEPLACRLDFSAWLFLFKFRVFSICGCGLKIWRK